MNPATPKGKAALTDLNVPDFRDALRAWSVPERIDAIQEMLPEEAAQALKTLPKEQRVETLAATSRELQMSVLMAWPVDTRLATVVAMAPEEAKKVLSWLEVEDRTLQERLWELCGEAEAGQSPDALLQVAEERLMQKVASAEEFEMSWSMRGGAPFALWQSGEWDRDTLLARAAKFFETAETPREEDPTPPAGIASSAVAPPPEDVCSPRAPEASEAPSTPPQDVSTLYVSSEANDAALQQAQQDAAQCSSQLQDALQQLEACQAQAAEAEQRASEAVQATRTLQNTLAERSTKVEEELRRLREQVKAAGGQQAIRAITETITPGSWRTSLGPVHNLTASKNQAWLQCQLLRAMPVAQELMDETVALLPAEAKSVLVVSPFTDMLAQTLQQRRPDLETSLCEFWMGPLNSESEPQDLSARINDHKSEVATEWDIVLFYLALGDGTAYVGDASDDDAQLCGLWVDAVERSLESLQPHGHVLMAEQTGGMGAYQAARLLEHYGASDVEVAWRRLDCFICGGRMP